MNAREYNPQTPIPAITTKHPNPQKSPLTTQQSTPIIEHKYCKTTAPTKTKTQSTTQTTNHPSQSTPTQPKKHLNHHQQQLPKPKKCAFKAIYKTKSPN